MPAFGKIIVIYLISISLILLGMRPYLYALAKIPFNMSWNIIAEEEEEHKKKSSDKCEVEEKIKGAIINFSFTAGFLSHHYIHILKIKENYRLAYPGPPPQS